MKRLLIFLSLLLWALVGHAAPQANTHYFSDDGHILLHIDFQRLQKGKTPQKVMGMMMGNLNFKQNLNQFKVQFGIDPFKDIDSLTMNIKVTRTGQDPIILMHVVGTFNQKQLLAGLTQQGNIFEQETIQGKVAHISAANKSALSFVSNGVIMGNPEQVRKSLAGVKFGGALAEQQAQLSEGGDLWFAAYLPEAIRAEAKQRNPLIADSKVMRGYLDFAEGLHVMMTTEFISAEVATQVAAKLGQVVTRAKQSPQAAMFMNMINKLSVQTQGDALTLDLPLSQEDVDQIQAIVSMLLMSLSMNQADQPQPGVAPQAPRFPRLTQPTAPTTVSPMPKAPVVPPQSSVAPTPVTPTK